ncbi:MAG: hypothetical protein MJ138_02960, partial [Kiritimatiellae bacterium]|nr:hypothetical protein [Kiritimatiellia bacterium]
LGAAHLAALAAGLMVFFMVLSFCSFRNGQNGLFRKNGRVLYCFCFSMSRENARIFGFCLLGNSPQTQMRS